MKSQVKTLGILGGGQLGRMSTLAAANLGIRVHIYCPDEESPASQVAEKTYVGNYSDKKKLRAFANGVDVVSYEFENIPVETVRFIENVRPVFPNCKLLEISQNRITEKRFLNNVGISTAHWTPIRSAGELAAAVRSAEKKDFILKTARFGYDGKGQLVHKAGSDPKKNFERLNSKELILEEKVNFSREISVIIARDKNRKSALYGPVLNEHKNHILSKSTIPAPIEDKIAAKALKVTRKLAEALDLIGVLALEMFVTKDGRILANEIAPRTHNSGHWTIDACYVSQFEQHVRTVCGLPVGNPARHSNAVMINFLGSDVDKVNKYYKMKGSCIHLYGKSEIRKGRKMGHITILKPIK